MAVKSLEKAHLKPILEGLVLRSSSICVQMTGKLVVMRAPGYCSDCFRFADNSPRTLIFASQDSISGPPGETLKGSQITSPLPTSSRANRVMLTQHIIPAN